MTWYRPGEATNGGRSAGDSSGGGGVERMAAATRPSGTWAALGDRAAAPSVGSARCEVMTSSSGVIRRADGTDDNVVSSGILRPCGRPVNRDGPRRLRAISRRPCHTAGVAEVADYISGLDEPARSLLERYRARAVELVPTASEGTSYGMAALRYRGRPLVSVLRTKQGYSVYPFSPEAVSSVLSVFGDLDATKGGIRFTEGRPLPDAAFDALVIGRRDEIDTALTPR